jgi:hypothetical protein
MVTNGTKGMMNENQAMSLIARITSGSESGRKAAAE